MTASDKRREEIAESIINLLNEADITHGDVTYILVDLIMAQIISSVRSALLEEHEDDVCRN